MADEINVGDIISFGNFQQAVVCHVYDQPLDNGAIVIAVTDPTNPASYMFKKGDDGRIELIDEPSGGSYVRPVSRHWDYAVKLRSNAGIKNPSKY